MVNELEGNDGIHVAAPVPRSPKANPTSSIDHSRREWSRRPRGQLQDRGHRTGETPKHDFGKGDLRYKAEKGIEKICQ